jgi:hypothetical protein
MINLVTQGEIQIGMILVIIESQEVIFTVDYYTGEKTSEQKKINTSPWYKGIPYRVVGVAGPIVAVENPYPNQMPIMFLDSRLLSFIEVEESYLAIYKKHNEISQKQLTDSTNSNTIKA